MHNISASFDNLGSFLIYMRIGLGYFGGDPASSKTTPRPGVAKGYAVPGRKVKLVREKLEKVSDTFNYAQFFREGLICI